jgi:hypothetical protein
LSYAFIGPYFLSPYLSRYEEALNLAAIEYSVAPSQSSSMGQDEDQDGYISVQTPSPATTAPVDRSQNQPYTLIRSQNVGMTVVMLFARDPKAVRDVQEAEVGFGAAEMGNKGAAGLRVTYHGTPDAEGTRKSTELTFVATHLAAMEWNLPRRNANWAAIMRGLTFGNPEEVLRPKKKVTNPPKADGEAGSTEGDNNEQTRLLEDDQELHQEHILALQSKLQDISVFKATSHLFVAGDLNYRISTRSPTPLAAFPSLEPESENFYPRFFPLDQLTRERKAGRTLHGLSEAEVNFPPTYKYNVLPREDSSTPDVAEDVPWEFAAHRYPSWTDRILFLDVAPWVRAKATAVGSRNVDVGVRAYNAMPVIRSSDHRAVFLRATVPLLSAEEMRPSRQLRRAGTGLVDLIQNREAESESGESTSEYISDPRVRLPVAIDPEAWERRAAARRREVLVGWSMFLWSTQQGAVVLGTALAVTVGGWWLIQGWS